MEEGIRARLLYLARSASGPGRGASEDIERTVDRGLLLLERAGGRAVLLDDPAYPAGLRDLAGPPPVIFLSGHWAPTGPCVAIVGARDASDDGCDVARSLGGAMAERGVAVVSGLARGIDAAAHRGALEAGGESGAVLGTGLDRSYPVTHRALQTALAGSLGLMSALLPGIAPTPATFASRNRLLAAIADAVIVVQGRDGSGALLTALAARRLKRPVGAVPWDSRDPLGAATHALIRAGAARLVREAGDVMELLGRSEPSAASRPQRRSSESATTMAPLGDLERRLLLALRSRPQPLDVVARRAALNIAEAGAALVILELLGRARREPGGSVRRLGQG